MANKFTLSTHPAKTCDLSDLAALRRQIDQIELDRKNNIDANGRIDKIQQFCNAIQSESRESLADTARRELDAHNDRHFYMKRTQEINGVIKALNDAESVDACFLMDCTNSMKEYIEEVKERIFETVALLKSRFPQITMHLAFVGYRDLNLPVEKQFSILDFTNEQEFHSYVSLIQCEWGDDYCEDVLGGLQKTTQLSWKRPVRILMHVGDAPSHGKRYHDLSERKDHYLQHDTDGSIGCSHILELIELKVNYFFGRLTPYTDKMIEEFRKYAENQMSIEQIDVKNFKNLLPFMVESVSRSISQETTSILKQHSMNDRDVHDQKDRLKAKSHRNIVFDEKEPIWSAIEPRKMQVIKYECNDELCCKKVTQFWSVKIARNPFAEGGMRIAYYGLTQYKEDWEKTVLKEYKTIGNGSNKTEKYLELLDCQTVAEYLAKKFNKLPAIADRAPVVKKIKFIMTKLVFQPLPEERYRNMTMERFIEGSYKKFSNNAGYVNYDDPEFTLQAFSHWTYERTNGTMIVVDLQGITIEDNQTYLLTDPCIHSTDLKRFGRTNLGKAGMKRFFQTHVCNIICHALMLQQNKYQPDLNKVSKYDTYFVNKPNKTVSN